MPLNLRIVADDRVPVDEVWVVQPVKRHVSVEGGRITVTEQGRIVGKIVNLIIQREANDG